MTRTSTSIGTRDAAEVTLLRRAFVRHNGHGGDAFTSLLRQHGRREDVVVRKTFGTFFILVGRLLCDLVYGLSGDFHRQWDLRDDSDNLREGWSVQRSGFQHCANQVIQQRRVLLGQHLRRIELAISAS